MKILSIQFDNDEVLGDLTLDFSGLENNAVDTVILAGENGCGKTSILEALYRFSKFELTSASACTAKKITVTYQVPKEQLQKIGGYLSGEAAKIIDAIDGIVSITKDFSETTYNYSQYKFDFKYSTNEDERAFSSSIYNIFNHADLMSLFRVSFSTVEINYNPKKVSTVTSKDIDDDIDTSSRSGDNLATEIKQLFVDIQNNDAIELSEWVHDHPGETPPEEVIDRRIKRFNRAFSYIFDTLRFRTIRTQDNEKRVIFTKHGEDIQIESLSSGEKQIVFRGAFLLKNLESTKGRIVLIDEPEISLHPNWQIKILDFYKNLFIDDYNRQTSQLIVATHSPFVIHNKNRKNDKIVVLKRTIQGDILVEDHPEYYDCNSKKVVEDAFQDAIFFEKIQDNLPTVYLEGRTDEKYFNKAIEVFGYTDLPFVFKWVGYLDNTGNEVNTGKDSLGKAEHFLISLNRPVKTVCLFDCDTSRSESEKNNVISYAIGTYNNTKGMKRGIENALVLDNVDLSMYYSTETKYGNYGEPKIITEFDKMACCDGICSMDKDVLKQVFANLKTEIEKLLSKFR